MTPEAQFLLASLKGNAIVSPASIEWNGFLRLADSHGVLPVFRRRYLGRLPESLSNRLRNRWVQSQVLATELEDLLDQFARHKIEVLALKGPVLAELLYADVTQRPCDDLDVLVRPGDFAQAQSVLMDQGFVPIGETDDYHREFERRGTFVELHFGIASRSSPHFDLSGAWDRAATVTFRGRSIRVFSPCDLILYLALHGLKHHFARLVWILDIARALETIGERDGCQLFDYASSHDLKNLLLLTCELARQSFDIALPTEIAVAIAAKPAVAAEAAAMINRILANEADPRTSVHDARYHIHLADSIRQRWKQRYQFFFPTRQDHLFLARYKLPSKWAPFLRPFRLLFKYGPTVALRGLFPGYFGPAEMKERLHQPDPSEPPF